MAVNGKQDKMNTVNVVSRKDKELADDENSHYGWFGWSPACLQTLNQAGWLIFFMFWASMVQSMVANGLVGVVLSSLETRFKLTSGQSAWIPGVYDAAGVIVVLVIIYVGSRCHRPFWTGVGEFVVCLGCVVFVLPHFLTDNYVPTGRINSLHIRY